MYEGRKSENRLKIKLPETFTEKLGRSRILKKYIFLGHKNFKSWKIQTMNLISLSGHQKAIFT